MKLSLGLVCYINQNACYHLFQITFKVKIFKLKRKLKLLELYI